MSTFADVLSALRVRECSFLIWEGTTRHVLAWSNGVECEHCASVFFNGIGVGGGAATLSIDHIAKLNDRWPQDGWNEVRHRT